MRKLRLVVALAGAMGGCRISELVTPPADGRVVFTVQPSAATAGQAITPAVQVTVLDASGVRDTLYNGPVTIQLAANPGGAKLSGDTIEPSSAGRATFDNLRLDMPANGYQLRASAPYREATVSQGFEVRATTPPPQNQPPVASFSSSCSGLTCDFTDGSSDADGSIAARAWDFGDGGTATSQNPSHTYASAGTYTVRLIVTDDDGAKDTTTRSVTVTAPPPPPPPPNQPPVAGFSKSCVDLSCSFTDQSSDPDGSVTAWSWNFGDGGTSSSENPSHSYASAGTYTVRLIVTDNDGARDTTTQTVSVTAPPPPNRPPTVNAGSDATVLVGTFTLSAAFSDPDGNGPYDYTIDWGDGTSTSGSTSSSPITEFHLFLVPGAYTIRVTVTDRDGASGSDSMTLTVIL